MKDLVINNLKEFVETHFVTETGSSLVLSQYQEKFIYDVLTGKNPLGKYVLVAATRVASGGRGDEGHDLQLSIRRWGRR